MLNDISLRLIQYIVSIVHKVNVIVSLISDNTGIQNINQLTL